MEDLDARTPTYEELAAECERLRRACAEGLPREVILCPACGEKHVEGPRHDNPKLDGRTRPHHDHRCYLCRHVWPTKRWSFGVAEPSSEQRLRALCDGRTTPPTDDELAAHRKAGGYFTVDGVDCRDPMVAQFLRAHTAAQEPPAVWHAFNAKHALCDWPSP